jgi:NAD(P)-dependent dehydrogenase (short-subunit alcohol dehydrogenase family)
MKQISFAGRVAVITGSGGGIGRCYALEIARRGGQVLINDLGGDVAGRNPSPDMADKVAAEIRAAYQTRAVANYESVATEAGAERIVEQALREFGKIDVLINNAGIMRNAAVDTSVEEDVRAEIDTHLCGAIFMTRAVWPHMRKAGYGRIVFTSSDSGMYGNATQLGYAAAKAGVLGVMNVCALEGEKHGILCNAIMPTAVGRMSEGMLKHMDEDAIAQATAVLPLLGNAMQPEFNAGLGVYLASEACTVTHRSFSSSMGRIGEVVIGTTHGWQGSRQHPASAEDIAAHWDEIRDLSGGLDRPSDPQELVGAILARSRGNAG